MNERNKVEIRLHPFVDDAFCIMWNRFELNRLGQQNQIRRALPFRKADSRESREIPLRLTDR